MKPTRAERRANTVLARKGLAPIHQGSGKKALSGTWFNPANGLGGQRNRFLPDGFIHCRELAQIYDGDWLARKIVQLLPSFALRRGFEIEDATDSAAILTKFNALNSSIRNPDGVLKDGLFKGRLLAGAAIIVGLDSDPKTPAEPGQGDVRWLDVVRRDQLRLDLRNEDANSPRFHEAELYGIVGQHPRAGLSIHASRVILCEGIPQEDLLFLSRSDGYPFPWLSVLQPVLRELSNFNLSWSAISHLLQEASMGVMTMNGLIEMLSSEDSAEIDARLSQISQSKSVARTVFLDAQNGETFTRAEVGFTGIAAVIAQVLQVISAAADAPATLVFGTSPAGMNATGESDLTNWYDRVCAYQESTVKPKIERLLSFVAGRALTIKFPSPWEPTETEAATTRLAQAQADQIYYTIGAVTGAETAISRSKDGTLGIDVEIAAKQALLAVQAKELLDPTPPVAPAPSGSKPAYPAVPGTAKTASPTL